MKLRTKDFRIPEGKPVDLKKWPTEVDPYYRSKKEAGKLLAQDVVEIGQLQELLYATDQYALLLIFQGMDAAGKDGAISHVLTGVNPQGCDVSSFKQPSAEELSHDFLWRTTCRLPARGRIGVFNRSYYEEVLIARVHPQILINESFPASETDRSKFWSKRYESIVDFETHLHRNRTVVRKFFLHLSKDEQRKRFLARLDIPEKNWKFSPADLEERKFWPEYTRAFEECLAETSTDHAPWYAIPADDKSNARLIISRIVIETLQELDLHFPKVTRTRLEELSKIRKQLQRSD